MEQMTVQIVTPDGMKYNHHSSFISVRTPEGDMGVLPEHENLIAPLIVHEMKIRRIDDVNHVDWVAINGGIIEIKNNLVTIIADSAERDRDIDVSRAERAKLRAEKALQEANAQHSIDQVKRARVALQRAINRIHVGNK